MKKILFFALGLSAIFNSCIWKNDYNYYHSAAHDMYYSWEYNTSSIMNNYVVKAFMFNVWWEGNDTVRSLVEENYFNGYKNVRQAGENTYELCANPNLPSDWYYRFETNGTSLNAVGATWTVYANAIYKNEEDSYYQHIHHCNQTFHYSYVSYFLNLVRYVRNSRFQEYSQHTAQCDHKTYR